MKSWRVRSTGVVARLWAAPLWAHALAYAVVLAAAFPLLSPEGAFSNDEGAYAAQAASLREGGWAYPYEAVAADPEGRYFPIILSVRREGSTDVLTYAHHPAYPRALAVVTDVAGQRVGIHLPALIGAVLTAVAAWLLARELVPGGERAAFWLAATGPVLVNAHVIWAHAPSAALGGLLLVAAVRVVRHGPSPLTFVALAACSAAGVLLRSEALFASGVAAVVVLFGRGMRLRPPSLVAAAIPLGAGIGARLAEQAWRNRLTGGAYVEPERTSDAAVGFAEGRFRGAWHDLLSGVYTEARAGDVLVAALVVVVAAAVLVRWRRGGNRSRLLPAATLVAVGLIIVRVAWAPRDPVTGLLPAWPAVALGLVLLPWRGLTPVLRALAFALGLFTAAVLATNYPYGGGLEWGGRFFSPIVVPLAVVAVVGLRHAGVLALRSAGVLAVATAVMGLVLVGGVRGLHDGQVAAVERHLEAWTVTDFSPLPRLAWRLDDETAWLLADVNPIDGAIEIARGLGAGAVTVVQREEKPVAPLERFGPVEEHAEPDLNRIGYRIFTVSP